MTNKAYLGDSVYAQFDGHQIMLTTENGYGASNAIYIDNNVFLFGLLKYAENVWDIKISVNKKLPPNKVPICQVCQELNCECDDEPII